MERSMWAVPLACVCALMMAGCDDDPATVILQCRSSMVQVARGDCTALDNPCADSWSAGDTLSLVREPPSTIFFLESTEGTPGFSLCATVDAFENEVLPYEYEDSRGQLGFGDIFGNLEGAGGTAGNGEN